MAFDAFTKKRLEKLLDLMMIERDEFDYMWM